MTHSGGKPHTNVGDRGQRYEVSYADWDGARFVIGWSDVRTGVGAMVEMIAQHQTKRAPQILDRTTKTVVMLHEVAQ